VSALRSLSYGVYGAYRLARLDRTAMLWFDRSIDGLYRSFWAAAVAYPGFLILLMLRVEPAQWQQSGLWRILAVETIGYVIGWTLFPLVILPFCRWLGRAGEAIDFIIAYNWSQVLQTGLFLGLAALEGGGLMPGAAAGPIFGLAFLAVLAYEWFIARIALDAGGVAATAVVLIDLVLGAVVNRVTLSLY
jgi:hypothetical protein